MSLYDVVADHSFRLIWDSIRKTSRPLKYLVFKIMEQNHPNLPDHRLLIRKDGTYALILHCPHQRIIDIGKLGKMNVRKGCYIYVGSAFGSGGVAARIKHHCGIAKSAHWHIDYLRPAVEITEIWYSHDPIKREHQWAGIFMGVDGVKLPLRGFGSSDCNCDSHLFFFTKQPTVKMFRTWIVQAIPDHHKIEWIKNNR